MTSKNLLDFDTKDTLDSDGFLHQSSGGVDYKIPADKLVESINGGRPATDYTFKDESSSARSITTADRNSYITFTNVSGCAVSLNLSSLEVGDSVVFRKAGGVVNVNAVDGATVNGSASGTSMTETGQTAQVFCKQAGVYDFVTGGNASDILQGSAVCLDVASMIAGVTVEGVSLDYSVLAAQGNIVKTVYNNLTSKVGGADYIVKTLVQAGTDGDVIDGVANHACGDGISCVILSLLDTINLAQLGLTETTSSSDFALINASACEQARNLPLINRIDIPAGNYTADFFVVDIDKRGFTYMGAGQDRTIITSKAINGPSMLVTRMDPRNRARDKLHDYLTIGEFTIDGDLVLRDSTAATKCVIQANYCVTTIKSIGHTVSNMDINGLVCDYRGHTEGRQGVTVYTQNGLRMRNNSISASGRAYTNGVNDQPLANALNCDDGKTETSSPITSGEVVITVVDAAGLEEYDRIEVGDSPDAIDVRYIIGKSGNVLTLDSPLDVSRSGGATVRLPVISNEFNGTIEVGRVYLNNCISFVINATYMEESNILVRGLQKGLLINGISNAQSAPSITLDEVDKLSSIAIHDLDSSFNIAVNLRDRQGGQGPALDLYNMPELEIDGTNRAQGKISVNGVIFTSLKVRRNYDDDISDRYQTDMWFSGRYMSADALATETALSIFLDPSGTGFDGVTFNVEANCRRAGSSGVRAGIMTRVGTSSSDGVSNISDTVKAATSYAYSAEAGNRADVLFSGGADNATIRVIGEQSGGQSTRFMVSGKISSVY